MSMNYKFEGWIARDPSAAQGNMVWEVFQPKPWEESDIDIQITHCGVCGSDVHVLRSGWVSSLLRCSPLSHFHLRWQI